MTTWQYRPDTFTGRDIEEAVRLFKSRPCGAGTNGRVTIHTARPLSELPQLDGVTWVEDEGLRPDLIAVETAA